MPARRRDPAGMRILGQHQVHAGSTGNRPAPRRAAHLAFLCLPNWGAGHASHSLSASRSAQASSFGQRKIAAAIYMRVQLDLALALGDHQVGEAHRPLMHRTRRVEHHPAPPAGRLRGEVIATHGSLGVLCAATEDSGGLGARASTTCLPLAHPVHHSATRSSLAALSPRSALVRK